MPRPTEKEEEALAKQFCFFHSNFKCDSDCENCQLPGTWRQYRVPVRKVVKLWENLLERRIKNDR